jgi:hypothetical protein
VGCVYVGWVAYPWCEVVHGGGTVGAYPCYL